MGMLEDFQKEVESHFDSLSPDEFAREWSEQLSGPGGSKEGAMIYHSYWVDQPVERRNQIQERRQHYSTQIGEAQLELESEGDRAPWD